MEPMSYKSRHDELAEEMLNRGMNHKSPLEQPDFSYLPEDQRNYKVDTVASLAMLRERCVNCRELH